MARKKEKIHILVILIILASCFLFCATPPKMTGRKGEEMQNVQDARNLTGL